MNWNQVEGKWDQLKGQVREKWGKLTDDDLEMVKGKRDILLGKIKERYGFETERAETELSGFLTTLEHGVEHTRKSDGSTGR